MTLMCQAEDTWRTQKSSACPLVLCPLPFHLTAPESYSLW
jgi:hypothetical protein